MADLYELSLTVDSKGMVSGFAQAGTAAKKFTEDAAKGHAQVKSAADLLDATVRKLAASYALIKMKDMAAEAVQLAARYQTLGVSMNVVGRTAGFNVAQLAVMQSSLQQTGISMSEARQNILRMASAQIDLSNATKLARVAQDAAVIGNMNSSEAFGRLVDGIETGNTEILRNLGIMVNVETAYQKYANTLGKNVDLLTEQQKHQAVVNEVLAKGALISGTYVSAMETASKQMRSTERYAEDLKVKIGETFLPEYTTAVFAYAHALQYLGENSLTTAAHLKTMAEVLALLGVGFGVAKTTAWLTGLSSVKLLAQGVVAAFDAATVAGTGMAGVISGLGPVLAAFAPALLTFAAAGSWLVAIGEALDAYNVSTAAATADTEGFVKVLKVMQATALKHGVEQMDSNIRQFRIKLGGREMSNDEKAELKHMMDQRAAYEEAYERKVAEKKITKPKEEKSAELIKQIREASEELESLKLLREGKITEYMVGTRKGKDPELMELTNAAAEVKYAIEMRKKVDQQNQDYREMLKDFDGPGGSRAIKYERLLREEMTKTTDVIKARATVQAQLYLEGEKDAADARQRMQDRADANSLIGLSPEQWAAERQRQLVRDRIHNNPNTLSFGQRLVIGKDIGQEVAQGKAEREFGTTLANMQTMWVGFWTNAAQASRSTFKQMLTDLQTMFTRFVVDIVAAKLGMMLAKKIASMVGAATTGVDAKGDTVGLSPSEILGNILKTRAGGIAGSAIGAGLIGYGVGKALYNPDAGQFGNYAKGALGGAAAGALVGSQIMPGIGTAVGAVAGFVGGIIGVGQASREAEKGLKEMRHQLDLSMQSLQAAATGGITGSLTESIAAVNADRNSRRLALEEAYSGGKNEAQRVVLLREMNKLEDERIAKLQVEFALNQKRGQEDLKVRLLNARGQFDAADREAFRLQQQREMQDAITAHADDATIALLAQVQAQEKLAFATRAATGAALNMVQGYRIQRTIYESMTARGQYSYDMVQQAPSGAGAPTSTPPSAPFDGNPATGGATGGGDITVNVVLPNGDVLATAVVSSLKAKSQRVNGSTQAWSTL